MTNQPKFQVGGTLDPEATVYVNRLEDKEFLAAAKRAKSWINIHGCRTMGKSSMYARHLSVLERAGIVPLVIDVGAEVGDSPTSAAEWFSRLAEIWTLRLGRDPAVVTHALASIPMHATAATVAERLLEGGLLTYTKRRVLLILDEYDYIATLPFCDAILFAFRHLQAVQGRSRALDQLSVCLVGLRPIHWFGRASGATRVPYCGTYIEMRDFEKSSSTVRALAQGFSEGATLQNTATIRKVLDLSGGQPLITIDLLNRLSGKSRRTPDVAQKLAYGLVAKSGLGRDLQLFESIEAFLSDPNNDAFGALSIFQSLIEGRSDIHSATEASLLLLSGLLRRKNGKLEIKGDLFKRRFDDAWAERMLSRVAGGSQLRQFRGGSKSAHKRICVLNTGGTLGMLQQGKDVLPPKNVQQFKAYFPALDSIAAIELHNLTPKDSINVFPDQWITIARYIYQRRHEFDGFVVAHGTDTMAYTASAVAFALGPRLSFPVVFTGAQTTPDVAYGDAHVNLYRACEVAKKPIHEVVICFGNSVFRAVRAQKRDDRHFDGFESPTYPALADITGEINIRTELLRSLPKRGTMDIRLRAHFERSVLIVPQFPGLEPEFFAHLLVASTPLRCNGVIVQTLGAGNVTNDDPYSFIPFVKRASSQGIPVIVTSQYPPDPGSHTKYTPAQAPLEAGAIHAGNMTLAAAVTKFRWVLADVRRQQNWETMSPDEKRALVTRRMVKHAIIGEF